MIARIPQNAYQALRSAQVITKSGQKFGQSAFQAINFRAGQFPSDGMFEATDGFSIIRQTEIEVKEAGVIIINAKLPAKASGDVYFADGAIRINGEIVGGYTEFDGNYPDTEKVVPQELQVLPFSSPGAFNPMLAAPILKPISKQLKKNFPTPVRNPESKLCMYRWESEYGCQVLVVSGITDEDTPYWNAISTYMKTQA